MRGLIDERYRTMATLAGAMQAPFGLTDTPVVPHDSVYDFVEAYNLSIDNVRIDWNVEYRHLRPVAEDTHPDLTLMAGAQTGKSVLVMAALARDCALHWGSTLGYYFPDDHLPRAFSTTRWAPMVRGNRDLGAWLGRPTRTGKGQDAVHTRTFGPTTVFFLTIAGKTSTEGLPMKRTYFDEVRRMQKGDVERALERMSAHRDVGKYMVSTANYPDRDIHEWFQRGDQRWFHSVCKCPDGVVLAREFPNCIESLKGASSERLRVVRSAFDAARMPYLGMSARDVARWGEAVYVCPKCGTIITDPREGYWEPDAPENWPHSYQLPQLLSPSYPAGRVWNKYENATDQQEFWNSTIGIPWVDPESQPVRIEHLESCVDPQLRWAATMGERWRAKHMVNCAMGVDVQAGYNVVVVKKRAPNGKHRTVHLEIVYGDDPWHELGRLMWDFDIRIAVVDGEPHWNEAARFVRAFKGRAWVADEIDGTHSPMVSWKDLAKKKDQRGDETRFKYGVTIHRTKGLQWSLGRWVRRLNETPDPRLLVQSLPTQKGKPILTSGLRIGEWKPVAICRDLYWEHQQAVAFKKVYTNEEAEAQGRYAWRAEHVRIDPHFAHANLFADVALARMGQPSSWRGEE